MHQPRDEIGDAISVRPEDFLAGARLPRWNVLPEEERNLEIKVPEVSRKLNVIDNDWTGDDEE